MERIFFRVFKLLKTWSGIEAELVCLNCGNNKFRERKDGTFMCATCGFIFIYKGHCVIESNTKSPAINNNKFKIRIPLEGD